MSKRSPALAAATLAVLLASPANAQTATWTEVCTDPAGPAFEFVTCMSGSLDYDAGTGEVNFWVWNLAGFDASYAQSRIDAFGLYGVPWGAGDMTGFAVENAGGTDRGDYWEVSTTGIPGGGCCSLTFGLTQDAGPKKDVVSSNHNGTPGGHDVTTWTGAGDLVTGAGAFKFSWFVDPNLVFDPEGVLMYAHLKESAVGQSDQFYCNADGFLNESCGGDNPDPPLETTVPEPATLTLLASGLVGLTAARKRRKHSA